MWCKVWTKVVNRKTETDFSVSRVKKDAGQTVEPEETGTENGRTVNPVEQNRIIKLGSLLVLSVSF